MEQEPFTVRLGMRIASMAALLSPFQPPLWGTLLMAVPVLFYTALLSREDPSLAEAVAPFEPCLQVVRLLLLHWVVLVHGGVVRQCATVCGYIKECIVDVILLRGLTDNCGDTDLPPVFGYPMSRGEAVQAQAALAAATPYLCRLPLVLAFGQGWLWVCVLWALSMVLATYTAAADAILPWAAVPVVPKQLLWGLYVCYGLVAAGPVYKGILQGPRAHEGLVKCMLPTIIASGYIIPPAMLRADAIWPVAAAVGSAAMYGVIVLCAVVLPVVCVVAGLARVVWLGWGCLQLGIDSLIAAWIGLQSVWLDLRSVLSVVFQAAYSSVQLCIAQLLRWPVVAWRSVAAMYAALLSVINAVFIQPFVAVPALFGRSVSTMHTVFGYFAAVPSAAHTHLHTHHQSSKETLQEGVTPVDTPSSGRLWVLLLGTYLGVAAVLVMQALWAKRQALLHRWRGHSSTTPPTNAAAAGGAQAEAAGSSAGMQQDLREVDPAVECIACQEAVRTVCLRPCGHVVLCAACFDTISKNARRETVGGRMACPICRQEVKRHERGLLIV